MTLVDDDTNSKVVVENVENYIVESNGESFVTNYCLARA